MNKAEKRLLVMLIRQSLHLEKDIEYISDDNIIHLKVMGKSFCLYIKSLTYAGNPYPQNTTRAQLPRREEFEAIKKDDSIFLFLGFDEVNDVFVCWDPVRTKERLNEKQYVSFFSRLNLQQSVIRGNIMSSTLINDFKYVLFNRYDLAYFLLHIKDYFPNLQFEHATIAVSNNTNGVLSKIEDDNSVKLLIDKLISMNEDVSDLTLMSSCMNEFGELYYKMTLKDWYNILKTYKEKTDSYIYEAEEETDTMSFLVAEPVEESPNKKLYYDNNGVSYIDGYYLLSRYPNGNHYDTIEVPEFITEINTWAFKDVVVVEIVLPTGIRTLNGFLFERCLNLRTITFRSYTPDEIHISENAFYCFDVEKCVLRVPYAALADYKDDKRFDVFKYITALEGSRCLNYNDDGTEVIGCYADNCEIIVIPEGVTCIAEDTFMDNKQITTVILPESLISIGACAFSGCTGLTSVHLKNNLEDIGYNAFLGTGLTKIEIPYSVNHVGITAFNCEMHVSTKNPDYDDLEGVLFDYYNTKLFIYPSTKPDMHYDVPNGVSEISSFAFDDSFLLSISLPDSIKILGKYIFNGCVNLIKLTILVDDPNEIEVDEHCFNGFNKKQCKLIVPKGSMAKYTSHDMFKDFLCIEEIITVENEEPLSQKMHTNTINENEIEHVYVDVPSAEPYTEIEYEDETYEDGREKLRVSIDPKKLDRIFEKKTTSYKFFWFMAIISLLKEKESIVIPYKDILVRMAAMAWPIVFDYRINLGKSDMLSKYLNEIVRNTPLNENSIGKQVEEYLSLHYDSIGIGSILEPLLKNVPYRFLSPWIPYTTDNEVVERSNSADCACLYALRDNDVLIKEEWWEYIEKNYTKICNFSERSFVIYLSSHQNHHNLAKFMAKGWSLV